MPMRRSSVVSDPLEGLEKRPMGQQVAVLANEVRNQRNMLEEVKGELRAVKGAMWGLIATVVIALIIFQLTTPRKSTQPASGARTPAVAVAGR